MYTTETRNSCYPQVLEYDFWHAVNFNVPNPKIKIKNTIVTNKEYVIRRLDMTYN